MKITSGPMTVLHTGSVQSFGGLSSVIFHLADNYRVVVFVMRGEPDSSPTIQGIEDDDGYQLRIINVPPPMLGWGPANPLQLNVNGVLHYAALRVSVNGEYSSFTVHYTIYKGIEAQ